MRITEVYFRSLDKKPHQQWFELQNNQEEPVNLRSAQVEKIDGKKNAKVAWNFVFPDEDRILEPGEFLIVAQTQDLGQNLCSAHDIFVPEFHWSLATKGVQKLCIRLLNQESVCVLISDSHETEKGFSRNLLAGSWFLEDCEIQSGFKASPGLPSLFCHETRESGWSSCPEKPIPMMQQRLRVTPSCSQAFISDTAGFAGVLIWILFQKLLWRLR